MMNTENDCRHEIWKYWQETLKNILKHKLLILLLLFSKLQSDNVQRQCLVLNSVLPLVSEDVDSLRSSEALRKIMRKIEIFSFDFSRKIFDVPYISNDQLYAL